MHSLRSTFGHPHLRPGITGDRMRSEGIMSIPFPLIVKASPLFKQSKKQTNTSIVIYIYIYVYMYSTTHIYIYIYQEMNTRQLLLDFLLASRDGRSVLGGFPTSKDPLAPAHLCALLGGVTRLPRKPLFAEGGGAKQRGVSFG